MSRRNINGRVGDSNLKLKVTSRRPNFELAQANILRHNSSHQRHHAATRVLKGLSSSDLADDLNLKLRVSSFRFQADGRMLQTKQQRLRLSG